MFSQVGHPHILRALGIVVLLKKRKLDQICIKQNIPNCLTDFGTIGVTKKIEPFVQDDIDDVVRNMSDVSNCSIYVDNCSIFFKRSDCCLLYIHIYIFHNIPINNGLRSTMFINVCS